MMAWSDGERINLVPSVYRQVNDYGHLIIEYQTNLDEGFEVNWGECTVARNECRCYEYEADHYWELGKHLMALKEMMRAAMYSLPDEGIYDDMLWFCPWETLFSHPNIQEFIRLTRRCKEYCKRDPKLLPVYNGSDIDLDYKKYCQALRQWRYDS